MERDAAPGTRFEPHSAACAVVFTWFLARLIPSFVEAIETSMFLGVDAAASWRPSEPSDSSRRSFSLLDRPNASPPAVTFHPVRSASERRRAGSRVEPGVVSSPSLTVFKLSICRHEYCIYCTVPRLYVRCLLTD